MKKDSTLKKSPIDFAEEGLKDFMTDKMMVSFNMGGGDADEKIRNVTGEQDYQITGLQRIKENQQ